MGSCVALVSFSGYYEGIIYHLLLVSIDACCEGSTMFLLTMPDLRASLLVKNYIGAYMQASKHAHIQPLGLLPKVSRLLRFEL